MTKSRGVEWHLISNLCQNNLNHSHNLQTIQGSGAVVNLQKGAGDKRLTCGWKEHEEADRPLTDKKKGWEFKENMRKKNQQKSCLMRLPANLTIRISELQMRHPTLSIFEYISALILQGKRHTTWSRAYVQHLMSEKITVIHQLWGKLKLRLKMTSHRAECECITGQVVKMYQIKSWLCFHKDTFSL